MSHPTAPPARLPGPADPREASVLVIGASVAGLAAAESLRRLGHRGELTLLGEEAEAPYDRPPLSKELLAGAVGEDRLALRPPAALDELGLVLRPGERAISLDAASRTVRIRPMGEDGAARALAAQRIVIATGLVPRRIPGPGADRVHVLRTLADARRLRAALADARTVSVIGDGVLGSEIAATAAGLGKDVALIESGPSPMLRQLGELGSALLAQAHREAGIRLVPGRRARRADEGPAGATRIVLDDGSIVEADVVVAATGSAPATDWLEGSGLDLEDGVLTDARLRAAPGIWAAGDVARFPHAGIGRRIRLENRTHAAESGLAVARDLLGEGADHASTPYFWSDQHGVRLDVYGDLDPSAGASDLEVLDGDPGTGRFVGLALRDGEPCGVLGWGMPKQARQHARALAAPRPVGLAAATR